MRLSNFSNRLVKIQNREIEVVNHLKYFLENRNSTPTPVKITPCDEIQYSEFKDSNSSFMCSRA